jgi:hypothetical protein
VHESDPRSRRNRRGGRRDRRPERELRESAENAAPRVPEQSKPEETYAAYAEAPVPSASAAPELAVKEEPSPEIQPTVARASEPPSRSMPPVNIEKLEQIETDPGKAVAPLPAEEDIGVVPRGRRQTRRPRVSVEQAPLEQVETHKEQISEGPSNL